MDPTISFVILRSIERILAVLIGCFLIFLGYRLFLEIPAKEDSEGKFTLPGGTAIHLTRVGPGVFFSLFGTAIVIFSFVKPVNYNIDAKTFFGITKMQSSPNSHTMNKKNCVT